ncbi:MAG: PqqD family protein [Acidimicrobiales bacterium]
MRRALKDSVFTHRDRVLAKASGGSLVLLDIDSGNYFSTNDVGALVWELSDGTRSVSVIVAAIAAEYEVELDVVESDVMELVDELVAESLLLPQDV